MCLVLKANKEKPRSLRGFGVCVLAEGEGFEPSIRNFRMPPFQGGTFNHSATLPYVLSEHAGRGDWLCRHVEFAEETKYA